MFYFKNNYRENIDAAVKEMAKNLIYNLSDNTTIDKINHALYIKVKLEQAEKSILRPLRLIY